MHPPSRLFSTAAVALLLLGVAVPTPETTTTSTTLVRTSIGDRTSEDTRSLRAMDAPTHEMTELDEDRFIVPPKVLALSENLENVLKAALAKTPWKDYFYKMPPKDSSVKIPLKDPSLKKMPMESSSKIPVTISRQENPTEAQLKAREKLLELTGEKFHVKDFDNWLEAVVRKENHLIKPVFERWKSADLDVGRLKTLLEGAGKGDDSVVFTLAEAFGKYLKSK